MPPKNHKTGERATRSSSRGRSPAAGPSVASTASINSSAEESTCLSHTDDESPPASETNKVGASNKGAVSDNVNKNVLSTSSSTTNLSLDNSEQKTGGVSQKTEGNEPNGMGDNTTILPILPNEQTSFKSNELPKDSPPPKNPSEETLTCVLSELQEIKSAMGTLYKIDTIEQTTASISKELSGVVGRTTEIEEALEATTARVREMGDDITTLKTVAHRQEQTISNLKKMKTEIARDTSTKVGEMNELVVSYKKQVEGLQSTMEERDQRMSLELEEKIDKKFERLEQAAHFQSLREQAFKNRYNLVISGLAEDEQKSTSDLVAHYLSSTLNIKDVIIRSAERIGPEPIDQHPYIRPILVMFKQINHRNKVWRKRQVITGEKDDQKIRIHADLPKDLREGIQLLYKVAKVASKLDLYKTTKVYNYQLDINGTLYQPSQLEELPIEIRPSTISSPRSESSLAFFSCSSMLSNHYPSEFTLDGAKYYTVEQYLAVKRATFSDQPLMIQKASSARDPKQAKYILKTLKEDRSQEWYDGVEEVLLEGLRAKFDQNPDLRSFLVGTNQLLLGEASKDERWGIGMTLDDQQVLDSDKWNPTGNLLGRALMKIREELTLTPATTDQPTD